MVLTWKFVTHVFSRFRFFEVVNGILTEYGFFTKNLSRLHL